jgi:hypothetical protein
MPFMIDRLWIQCDILAIVFWGLTLRFESASFSFEWQNRKLIVDYFPKII